MKRAKGARRVPVKNLAPFGEVGPLQAIA